MEETGQSLYLGTFRSGWNKATSAFYPSSPACLFRWWEAQTMGVYVEVSRCTGTLLLAFLCQHSPMPRH